MVVLRCPLFHIVLAPKPVHLAPTSYDIIIINSLSIFYYLFAIIHNNALSTISYIMVYPTKL